MVTALFDHIGFREWPERSGGICLQSFVFLSLLWSFGPCDVVMVVMVYRCGTAPDVLIHSWKWTSVQTLQRDRCPSLHGRRSSLQTSWSTTTTWSSRGSWRLDTHTHIEHFHFQMLSFQHNSLGFVLTRFVVEHLHHMNTRIPEERCCWVVILLLIVALKASPCLTWLCCVF